MILMHKLGPLSFSLSKALWDSEETEIKYVNVEWNRAFACFYDRGMKELKQKCHVIKGTQASPWATAVSAMSRVRLSQFGNQYIHCPTSTCVLKEHFCKILECMTTRICPGIEREVARLSAYLKWD
jgi:hypothetical protein